MSKSPKWNSVNISKYKIYKKEIPCNLLMLKQLFFCTLVHILVGRMIASLKCMICYKNESIP